MPLVLTCDCGARFEVDDHLADRAVSCPDCLQPVSLPPPEPGTPPASWLALFSLLLALAGAVTVVGGAAAAILGVAALVRIHRHPTALSGTGFALAGITLGLTSAGLTLLLLPLGPELPVAAWVRQRILASRLDPATPSQVFSRDGACSLTRPSPHWALIRTATSGDPAVDDLQEKRDLLLIHPGLHAYADLARDPVNPMPNEQTIRNALQPPRAPLLGEEDDNVPQAWAGSSQLVGPERRLELVDEHTGREWVLDVVRGGQTWRFLVRAYRKQGSDARSPAIIVRVYAPRRLFEANEEELRRLLDSIRFSP